MAQEVTDLDKQNSPQQSEQAPLRSAVTNFARFYALLNELPGKDRDHVKRDLVWQYTGKRTESLKEMTNDEYETMCADLLRAKNKVETAWRVRLREKRSACLKLMQQLGIDTTDWARINGFCVHPRIAGKPFASLSENDLDALAKKLRSIRRNGGLKPITAKTTVKQPAAVAYIFMDPNAPKN